jgi:hypothetical protein
MLLRIIRNVLASTLLLVKDCAKVLHARHSYFNPYPLRRHLSLGIWSF